MFSNLANVEKVVLPKVVLKNIETYFGQDGLDWASNFDTHVKKVCSDWELSLQEPFPNLSVNFVAPVTLRSGSQAVLKIGYPNKEIETECNALAHFNGEGAVRLLKGEAKKGLMLLEYITPGKPLKELHDDDQATKIAASCMQKIWKPAADPTLFPSVSDWLQGLSNLRQRFNGGTGPFDEALFATAERIGAELLSTMGEQVVLHGDLHHDNIVSSQDNDWIVIDPKGVIGEREYEVGALLRNPSQEIYLKQFDRRTAILAEELSFDKERIKKWAFVQAVLSAVWGVDGSEQWWKPVMGLAREIQEFNGY